MITALGAFFLHRPGADHKNARRRYRPINWNLGFFAIAGTKVLDSCDEFCNRLRGFDEGPREKHDLVDDDYEREGSLNRSAIRKAEFSHKMPTSLKLKYP
jgi:hypothetical protein